MKPTPEQRRILRQLVGDGVLALNITRLKWLNTGEAVSAAPCAYYDAADGVVTLTERGRWAARDIATSLFSKACDQQGRARTAWFAALEHAANPHRAPVLEVMAHAERIMERARMLMLAVGVTTRAREKMRAWEDLVPRPRHEARMAKHIPGYVPRAPLTVCEKHLRVDHE